jgi:hypothetical protein
MAGLGCFKLGNHMRGAHHLITPLETFCETADTYYKILGIWGDGDYCNCGFDIDCCGKITYTESISSYTMLVGISDLKVDKNCEVTYGLYKNGNLITNAETPRKFEHANQTANVAITNILKNNSNDYYEIYVKSDTNSTTVTTRTLMLSFLGEI